MRYCHPVMLATLGIVACGSNSESATHFSRRVELDSGTIARIPVRHVRTKRRFCSGREAIHSTACQLLTTVRAVFGIPHGVVVLDASAGLIRLDSLGMYVGDIGSLGASPGSYTSVGSLIMTPDGTVTIGDTVTGRVITYYASGRSESLTLRPIRNVNLFAQAGPSSVLGLAIPFGDSIGAPVRGRLGRISSDGGFTPLVDVPVAVVQRRGESFAAQAPFYVPSPRWAVGPDGGVAYVLPTPSGQFVLNVYDSAGGPRWTVHGWGESPPVNRIGLAQQETLLLRRVFRTHADEFVQRCAHDDTSRYCGTLKFALRRLKARAPRRQPSVTRVRILSDGSIWLRGPEPLLGGQVIWLGLSADGRPITRLMLGAGDDVIGGMSDDLVLARPDSAYSVAPTWVTTRNPGARATRPIQ